MNPNQEQQQNENQANSGVAQGGDLGYQPVLPNMPGNGEAMDEVNDDGYVMLN